MAVVTLNHENACPHLLRKCVNVSTIQCQRKSRIRVPQAVECAILARSRTFKQTAELQKRFERLPEILCHCAIRKTEDGLVDLRLEQLLECHLVQRLASFMNALEVGKRV